MGLRLVEGRVLNDADRDGTPFVVVINETFARTYFPGIGPVGRQLLMRRIPIQGGTTGSGPGRQAPASVDTEWTIVGVIADEGVSPYDNRVAEPAVYATREQHPRSNLALVVRTAQDPNLAQQSIRQIVAAFDHDQALADFKTLETLKAADAAPERLRAILVAVFATIGLVLTAIGLYGVIAYSAARRIHEMGVRMALGAQRGDVLRLVIGQGFRLTIVGMSLGAGVAIMLTRVMASMLYGVKPTDAPTFAATAVMLAVTALIACAMPAARAARVDPIKALHYE